MSLLEYILILSIGMNVVTWLMVFHLIYQKYKRKREAIKNENKRTSNNNYED